MHPELWTVPLINYSIKSYGFMLMVGFLSAIYVAAKRAEHMRSDPDVLINAGFFALLGGVGGARIMYVIHYWQRDFATHANPIAAIFDISKGGMEFLGGVIGAATLVTIYLYKKKASIRLYLDYMTPSLMWGLAVGRIGCFLNGCCWGGVCAGTVASAWGVSFPYRSPAYLRQFENRQLQVPAPLLSDVGVPLSRNIVLASPEERVRYQRLMRQAEMDYEFYKQIDENSSDSKKAKADIEKFKSKAALEKRYAERLERQLAKYPSKHFPGQPMTPSEIADIAQASRSAAVHPTQLYSSINGAIAALFLSVVLRIRKRHGMVFAVFLMTYPFTRLVIEFIRIDNPRDSFGITISGMISLGMLVCGLLLVRALRRMPEHSPAAIPWEPPPPEETASTS